MPADVTLDIDGKFDKIQRQLKTVFGKSIPVSIYIDPASIVKARNTLQVSLDSTPIRLNNVAFSSGITRNIKRNIQTELDRGGPIFVNSLSLGRGAAAQIRKEVQNALNGVTLPRFNGLGGNGGSALPRLSGGRSGGGAGGGLPLGKISGDASEFAKSLDAANARVLAFGASAGAIFLVGKAFSEIVTSTAEVDKALREINVLLGLTDSNLSQFGDKIFEIAKNTATGFKVAADAALEFSRQGLSVEDTLARTAAALNLTRLSGISSVKAVDALTTALNSFNKEGLTAAEVADKLAAVDAVAATSAGGLAEGVSRVGSAAADAGVSFDELLGLIASAKQITGRSESTIGNAFKTIFTRLDRSKVRDVLGGVVDIKESDSGIQILQKLAGAYDGLSRQQQAYISEITAGVFQINQFKAIVGDLGSEFSVFSIAQEAAANSSGVANARVKQLTQSLSDLAQIAGTNLQQAFAKIGKVGFEGNASDFLKDFNNIFDKINSTDAEDSGAKIATAFIKGISNVLTGPGAILASAVAGKLLFNLAGYAKSNTRELLGTDAASKSRAVFEERIALFLKEQDIALKAINGQQLTAQQIASDIVSKINLENEAYEKQLLLVKDIGGILTKQGVVIAGKRLQNSETTAKKTPSLLSRVGGKLIDPFNAALITSIGGEAAANSDFFDKNTKGGRGRGGASVASALGSAGSGAALGSLLGLGGAVLGGAIGAFSSLPNVLKSFTSDLPDIQKKLDAATTDFTSFSSLSQTILSLQSNYDNLITDVANGNASQKSLNKAQFTLAAEIAKLPEDLRKQYQAAGKLSSEDAFKERSSILNQEVARKQGAVTSQANNLALGSILDDSQTKQFYGKVVEGFFSFANKLPSGIIGNLIGGGGAFNPNVNAGNTTRGLGFQTGSDQYDPELSSRLRELASNKVKSSGLGADQLDDLAKNGKTVSDVLSRLGETADSDFGRLLTRLEKDSPQAFQEFDNAIRSSAKDFSTALKNQTEAQKRETAAKEKDAESLKDLTRNLDLFTDRIKNVNDLLDLAAANANKNRNFDRSFGVSALQTRGAQAALLGNERVGNQLNTQAAIRENFNTAQSSKEELSQEITQTLRDTFIGGIEKIFSANPANSGSKEAVAAQTRLTARIEQIFTGSGDINSKIAQSQKALSDVVNDKGKNSNANDASKFALDKLDESIKGKIGISNEKLTQIDRELQQANQKLAFETLNANIERLIKAAENAFGGISNFTSPNNALIDQLKAALNTTQNGATFADKQRGRFGALQSLTGLAGQSFLSDTNPDLTKTVGAYTTQLENQFSDITKSLKGVLDPQTIKEFSDAIKEQGGFKNIAQTQILKSLGVSSGGVFNQQIKKFQDSAIQNVPDQLLDALVKAQPQAKDETTVAVIENTRIIGGKIDQTNALLGGRFGGSNSSVVAATQSSRAALSPNNVINNNPNGEEYIRAQQYADGTGPFAPIAPLPVKSQIDALNAPSRYSKSFQDAEREKERLRQLNDAGYQNSLANVQGRDKAFDTIRNGGGTANFDIFKKIFTERGINPNDVNKPNAKQQAALDAVNQVTAQNMTVTAQAVTFTAPVFNIPSDATINFAGNAGGQIDQGGSPVTVNASVNVDSTAQVTQRNIDEAIYGLRAEIYKQLNIKVPPKAQPSATDNNGDGGSGGRF